MRWGLAPSLSFPHPHASPEEDPSRWSSRRREKKEHTDRHTATADTRGSPSPPLLVLSRDALPHQHPPKERASLLLVSSFSPRPLPHAVHRSQCEKDEGKAEDTTEKNTTLPPFRHAPAVDGKSRRRDPRGGGRFEDSGGKQGGMTKSAWEKKSIPAVIFSSHFPFSSVATSDMVSVAAAASDTPLIPSGVFALSS